MAHVTVAIKGEQITKTILHQVPRPVSPPTAPPVGIGLVEISETLETILIPGPMGPAGPPGPAGEGGASTWDEISGKPATFPPTVPIAQSDVTGLVAELAEKIEEAPADGAIYARQSASWVETSGVGGLSPTEYNYNTAAVVPPPNTNNMRMNNVNQTLVTAMYLHHTNALNIDISNALRMLRQGNQLLLQDKTNAANYQIYRISAAITDFAAYTTVPVTWISGGSPCTAGRVMLAAFGMGDVDEVVNGIITISNTAPSSPAVNDVWIDTT